MPKAAVAFTGCRVNRYEIQAISESLEQSGFEMVSFDDKADLYVVNTCGVTSKAEVSSRQLIRRARKSGSNSKIVVTGCYSELKRAEIESLGADLVVPNGRKERISAEIVELMGLDDSSGTFDRFSEFGSQVITEMTGMTRGFVKIQEGCDRKCTYCTIWMSRGAVRSRKAEFVIKEIQNLSGNGFKEIVLTGVHIGMYSQEGISLVGLLERILADTDIPRVRLSSLYPGEIDDHLIDLMASNPRICPHLHLSVQSGDNGVLQTMGRAYTREDLTAIVTRLNDSILKITVGADIITGFPGESERAFRNSMSLVEEAGIHHLHVFTFSPRPKTPAASMVGQIPLKEKKRRTRLLRGIGREMKRRHQSEFLGRELNVLFEKNGALYDGRLTGFSENYLRAEAPADKALRGEIATVVPYRINGDILLSELILRQPR